MVPVQALAKVLQQARALQLVRPETGRLLVPPPQTLREMLGRNHPPLVCPCNPQKHAWVFWCKEMELHLSKGWRASAELTCRGLQGYTSMTGCTRQHKSLDDRLALRLDKEQACSESCCGCPKQQAHARQTLCVVSASHWCWAHSSSHMSRCRQSE